MNDKSIEIALHEYDRLAAECVARIGYRDNLIYVTLATYGAIIAFVLHNSEAPTPSGMSVFGLLVLPWVSLILGWSYLTNDLKISEIGNYIRRDLEPRLKSANDNSTTKIFGYDYAHGLERHRKARKRIQFLIDELTFAFSGAGAMVTFMTLVPERSCAINALCAFEATLLAGLFFAFAAYRNPEDKNG
jgi:hypothetical protein